MLGTPKATELLAGTLVPADAMVSPARIHTMQESLIKTKKLNQDYKAAGRHICLSGCRGGSCYTCGSARVC